MNELPKRKKNRMTNYDYSEKGAYFITICVKDKHELLGNINVGDAPLRVPHCVLSNYGVFVDEQIQKVSLIYTCVSVANYVIMSNHIHMIVVIENGTRRGASPTKSVIPQIIQSLKSMTTKHFGFNMWQRSYHDHIIRSDTEYQKIWNYIDGNPTQWIDDCYYNLVDKNL